MTDQNDRESQPTPSTPPVKKEVWLPPRLRDKIEQAPQTDDFEIKPQSPIPGIITTIVVLAILGGGGWFIKGQMDKTKAAEAKVAAEKRAAEVADSLARVRTADSLVAVKRADSLAFAALPKWEQLKVLREKAAGGDANAKKQLEAMTVASAGDPNAGPFGVDAGEYLDETRAGEIAAQLKGTTGLDGKVVTRGKGDNATYHVVLGRFDARPAAEAAARKLLADGSIRQGVVVTVR